MKHIVFLLLLLFVIASGAFAQVEDPEPTSPPPISYEVEIAWGPRQANLQWATAPVVSMTTVAGNVDPHSYRWTTLGTTTWEFTPVDFDVTAPKKVQVVLDISVIGGPNPFWGFYRIRVRGVADLPDPEPDALGVWSEERWWVPVINIAFPGRPNRP